MINNHLKFQKIIQYEKMIVISFNSFNDLYNKINQRIISVNKGRNKLYDLKERFGEDAKKMILNPYLIPLPAAEPEDDQCCHFKIKRSKIDLAPITSLVKAQDFALVNNLEEIVRIFQLKTTFLGCPHASTYSKKYAFILYCNDISITICNSDHIDSETVRKYIKYFLGFRNDKQVFESPQSGPKHFKCRGCPSKTDGSIKMRGLKAPIDEGFTYFCSVNNNVEIEDEGDEDEDEKEKEKNKK
ncbi:hypothetical protein DICPUDRAFT_100084 [Dictyostelium purpureum]|uniref:Uncharacterized protein n=1 Tax=Dictyostelium purpureum TaxID=5786 RepID=F1A5A8_DICPU|nr:uncharacterized protein DICPUDRAFT_100084 [Dictyostelium purpureum]EGC28622.1 hypothetical protein DICPUDRAFT_100084 [Dictyostelium purpureum]|eukprot:XP_003294852.1 hypothetical protein DICPUDRAFT_100084 [Dictyostelium purpureum]